METVGYGDDVEWHISNPTDNEDEVECIVTTAYTYTKKEWRDLQMTNIEYQWVIAEQPINRGKWECSMNCDTMNHHQHVYCKACERQIFPGTEFDHNCEFGLGLGKKKPDMNNEHLVNGIWWDQPNIDYGYQNPYKNTYYNSDDQKYAARLREVHDLTEYTVGFQPKITLEIPKPKRRNSNSNVKLKRIDTPHGHYFEPVEVKSRSSKKRSSTY